MRLLIIALLMAFVINAQAKTSDTVKPGKCYPAFPFQMYITGIEDKNHYVIGSTVPVLASLGFLKTHKTSYSKDMIRLNIGVKYLKSVKIKKANGFEVTADLWEECDWK